jgi:hypothetical protein
MSRRTAKESLSLEAKALHKARAVGMELSCNASTLSNGKESYHWMFHDVDSGQRIVDYWPSTGTWYCPSSGERGKESDLARFFALAVHLRSILHVYQH